jgi:hypothetical protein
MWPWRIQERRSGLRGAVTRARWRFWQANWRSPSRSRGRSSISAFPDVLAAADSCLLVAVDGNDCQGYLLGFRHLTFTANAPVAWVEEVLVRREHRGVAWAGS